jgi:multiple sugar transport system ATP-binding protein
MNMVPAATLPAFSALTGGRLPGDGFLGVRPEGVRVRAGAGGAVTGRIELIEALGADTLIYVDVGGTSLVARQNQRTTLRPGDTVSVELDGGVLHLFNREGRVLTA